MTINRDSKSTLESSSSLETWLDELIAETLGKKRRKLTSEDYVSPDLQAYLPRGRSIRF